MKFKKTRSFLTLFLMLNGIYSYSQFPVDNKYNKLLKAVINIEVRSFDQKFNSFINRQFTEKNISEERWHEMQDSMKRARAKLGTAIFLKDGDHYFLLTARHMAIDDYIDRREDSNMIASSIMLIENDTLLNPSLELVYNHAHENYTERMLWMYNPYPENYPTKPYLLSSVDNDLAILCIDCDSVSLRFYKTLVNRGYVPLDSKDIDSTFNIKTGDNIYAIGFPENSIVAQIKYPGHIYSQLRTSIISIPVITQGTFLGEYPKKSKFFDAKMFVYKGFSGGPIMLKNKLIGIVSGGEIQEFYITDERVPFKYLIHNHSKFIKSIEIYSQLKELRKKIKLLDKIYNR